MSLLYGRKRKKGAELFDPNPGVLDQLPERPYRVLHAALPFYTDMECKKRIEEASLVVLRSEDPRQPHQVQECLPTRKAYRAGQLVGWDLDNKRIWQNCWYRDPATGAIEMAWTQAVEFIGKIITAPSRTSAS